MSKNNVEKQNMFKNNSGPGAVRQACKPSTLGCRGGWITRLRDRDHPCQHGETPSLLKVQTLARCGGKCLLSHLLGRLRQENYLNQKTEVAVSQDHATALWPGQQIETLPQKKSIK